MQLMAFTSEAIFALNQVKSLFTTNSLITNVLLYN